MAFENVNVTQLKSALTNCKNSLDNTYAKKLLSDISFKGAFECDAKKNLNDALDKLNNNYYKELLKKLDLYLSLANKIDEYKKLSKKNKDLNLKIDSLNLEISRTDDLSPSIIDFKKNEIKKINLEIDKNNMEMNSILNYISNSI